MSAFGGKADIAISGRHVCFLTKADIGGSRLLRRKLTIEPIPPVMQQVGAVVIASDPYLFSRREQIVSLAARQAMATVGSVSDEVAAGCLMSYGNSLKEAYRHAGLYVGRILRGAKPSELPIERLAKFEFVINLTTAKKLGLTVPASFLSLADELIE